MTKLSIKAYNKILRAIALVMVIAFSAENCLFAAPLSYEDFHQLQSNVSSLSPVRQAESEAGRVWQREEIEIAPQIYIDRLRTLIENSQWSDLATFADAEGLANAVEKSAIPVKITDLRAGEILVRVVKHRWVSYYKVERVQTGDMDEKEGRAAWAYAELREAGDESSSKMLVTDRMLTDKGWALYRLPPAVTAKGADDGLLAKEEHLLDVVHDILNYFTPIQGWLFTLEPFDAFREDKRFMRAYKSVNYLFDQRKRWDEGEDCEIEFYRLRTSRPDAHEEILRAGRDYIEDLKKALLLVRESPLLNRNKLKALIKGSQAGLGEPEDLTKELTEVFTHEVRNGLDLLDDYLSESEAAGIIQVLSEIQGIVNVFSTINAKDAREKGSRKIDFSVEVEGDEVKVKNAAVYINRSRFQNIIRNPIKNAVFNMPDQENSFIRVRISLEGDNVVIRITDNAGGIPIEHNGVRIRENMFKSRVSTKTSKQVSAIKGRGLTITKLYVEEAEGEIALEDTVTKDELGQETIVQERRRKGLPTDYSGTTMRIKLPIAKGPVAVPITETCDVDATNRCP